jgi:hypothetical protein
VSIWLASVAAKRGEPPLVRHTGRVTTEETTGPAADAEQQRLAAADAGREHWREWGPYVAQRAWGTVREDYSADGDAWAFFPFDDAVSRTYRWNEDGLGAWSDDRQRLCLGLALWNGVDPILKERPFGLSGHEGNHGEDVKEYWWNLDNTPTHSWMRWRYLYPTSAFPYDDLRSTNAARTRSDPEYELVDTGVFAGNRYVEVTTDWAKCGPADICLRISVANKGSEPVTVHVLPTVWFRNTWSWAADGMPRPQLRATPSGIEGEHVELGTFRVASRAMNEATGAGADASAPVLCCENETNARKLFGADAWAGEPATPYPKDGINDRVVSGAATVNPAGVGTKAAFHHVLELAAGEVGEVRVRLTVAGTATPDLGDEFDQVMRLRAHEADAFWSGVRAGVPAESALVARQAMAGLLATKQFYAYDVTTWLNGDPLQPPPPDGRRRGRNAGWQHLSAADVIVMPDGWEYPWFASWDLAFHCAALAHVDPEFAKAQLLLLLGDRYQHPSGQIPAYEWNFSDMNPPVQAWAAMQIYRIDGERDSTFLEHVLHKLVMNVTWWFNRVDQEGDNLFEGGFLGLDNIGPFDRSIPLPDGSVLEQSDGTAWTAMYCLDLLTIAVTLGAQDPAYDGIAATFLDRFCAIAGAANELGLWDAEDGFYYDMLRHADGDSERVRVRSAVGLVPIVAVGHLPQEALTAMPRLSERLRWLRERRPDLVELMHFDEDAYRGLLAVCEPEHLLRVLSRVLDPAEFLSDHGVRSLSADHRGQPVTIELAGHAFTVDYEPAESQTSLYGGNSNWRGPVWLPVNALLVGALRRYHTYCRGDLYTECPLGSGPAMSLGAVADELSRRIVGLFTPDDRGVLPAQANLPWQTDPLFFEYFDGDTGHGLGASHQTGWTALVASLALGWPQ